MYSHEVEKELARMLDDVAWRKSQLWSDDQSCLAELIHDVERLLKQVRPALAVERQEQGLNADTRP